eukprot:COSAG05_NODE_1505_length_4691_cov_73.111498_2_plen_223_part_00
MGGYFWLRYRLAKLQAKRKAEVAAGGAGVPSASGYSVPAAPPARTPTSKQVSPPTLFKPALNQLLRYPRNSSPCSHRYHLKYPSSVYTPAAGGSNDTKETESKTVAPNLEVAPAAFHPKAEATTPPMSPGGESVSRTVRAPLPSLLDLFYPGCPMRIYGAPKVIMCNMAGDARGRDQVCEPDAGGQRRGRGGVRMQSEHPMHCAAVFLQDCSVGEIIVLCHC